MAHVFLKPEVIVAQALGLLQREIVLGNLVSRYTENDFKGAKNDTINIPIRSRLVARENVLRATGAARNIIADDLNEGSIPLTLNKMPYSAVVVTDEELTLDIKDFGDQVLEPQVRAMVEKMENSIYTQIAAGSYLDGVNKYTWDVNGTGKTPAYNMAVRIRRILNDAFVPGGARVLLVGSNAEELILTDEKLVPGPNPTGFGESALRDATIGTLAGFTVVHSPLIPNNKAYALTREAFVFANVAPVVPESIKFGRRMVDNDFALRWIRDYDSNVLQDRSILNAFTGTGEVKDAKVPVGYVKPTGSPETKVPGDPYNARAVEITIDAS